MKAGAGPDSARDDIKRGRLARIGVACMCSLPDDLNSMTELGDTVIRDVTVSLPAAAQGLESHLFRFIKLINLRARKTPHSGLGI